MQGTKMSDTKKTEPTFREKTADYFRGVRAEWDKITWPEKKQVVVQTVVVLGVVLFFTTLVFILDHLFNFIFSLIPGG